MIEDSQRKFSILKERSWGIIKAKVNNLIIVDRKKNIEEKFPTTELLKTLRLERNPLKYTYRTFCVKVSSIISGHEKKNLVSAHLFAETKH